MKKIILFISGCFIAAAICGCASSGRVEKLESEILLLESRLAKSDQMLKAYETNRTNKDKSIRSQSASLRVEAEGLWENLSKLTGRIEETEHAFKLENRAIKKTSDEIEANLALLDKKIEEIELRLWRLENYLDFERIAHSAVKNKVTAPKKETPDSKLYEKAKSAFDQNRLKDSLQDFRELLKKFPKSEYADNAQFWIGEIYYDQKWYEKAILEYQKVIEKHSKGNKVRAALLKQGLSFLNIKDKANARLILKELVKKYPKTSEAAVARKKLKELK